VRPISNLLEINTTGALLWNKEPITRDALRYDLRQSQQMAEVPELHFKPAANARYEFVADALGIIKSENVRKVGFVGNEAYARW
jgi:biopolymer transport protein ExbD